MLISAFILASFAITSLDGSYFYIYKDFQSKGVCSYKGYMPGGGKPNISPIKPPTATMPANALAKIAGLGSKSAALAMHSSNLMKALGKGSALFLKIAPKLGPALGVFGAALGFVTAFTSPTPQDILNQANKAIAKLTAEVNDRLVKMEGYVDYKVIKLEKDLVNREYRSLFNLFGNCAKEATKDQVNECMRDAEMKAASDAPKYMILDTKMGAYTDSTKFRSYYDSNPSKAPSYYDVKRIEAGIISFRDYATLHLLMISTLLDTYKSDATLPNAAYYVTRYTREQASAAAKYAGYADWAYKWILSRNFGENRSNQFKKSCQNAKELKEGWFVPVRTAYYSHCSIQCTGMNTPANCDYRVLIRADGKRPSSYFSYYNSACGSCFSSVAVQYGLSVKGSQICAPFLASLNKDIKTYYDKTLVYSVNIWKEIAAKAKAAQGDEPLSNTHDAGKYDYSEKFSVRLRIARDQAKDQYMDSIRYEEKQNDRQDEERDEASRHEAEDDLEDDEDEVYDYEE
ncbi:uncharacterized protein LOC135688668 [Rhopilema esculentum]|uniref:uncharacterized protein LOC135688668 n=1 Tax=Rhopilema esculentum TaxID=499914 RepID=UPI0031DDCAB7|eukprot:gene2868-1105_t